MDKLKHKRPASNVILIIVGALVAVTIVFIAYWSLRNGNRVITRPQEPKEPFPYESVDITFFNESSDITLSGTLTVPSDNGDKFPAIILISGYGPQDRNAEWNNHKPFLVIADHLTRVGFAVLRYDDRGFGKSTGDYHSSTSLDFSTDVESAVEFLKSRDDIDFQQKISLIGHSDGAMVASILAARSKDIGSIILLGAPGILGSELMIKRQVLIDRKLGRSENEIEKSRLYMKTLVNIIANGKNAESIKNNLQKLPMRLKARSQLTSYPLE